MRPIDADKLINDTILNPLHVPYITYQDVKSAPVIGIKSETIIHAQWIPTGDHETCSNCSTTWVKTNYCPNCGAKMDLTFE